MSKPFYVAEPCSIHGRPDRRSCPGCNPDGCSGRVHPAVEAASWAELAGGERCHLWPFGSPITAATCVVCGITWHDHYAQPVCPGPGQ